jgi:hypothetical protein
VSVVGRKERAGNVRGVVVVGGLLGGVGGEGGFGGHHLGWVSQSSEAIDGELVVELTSLWSFM